MKTKILVCLFSSFVVFNVFSAERTYIEANQEYSRIATYRHCTPDYINAFIRRFGRLPSNCPKSMAPVCSSEFVNAYIRRFGRMPSVCPNNVNPICTSEYLDAFIRRFGRLPADCRRR